jgi:cupin fold WbuC family metalloprotein
VSETSLIDRALLERTASEALAAPRKRKNHNFHARPEDSAHRLLNAIEPGSYIQPHRHLDPAKDETFVVVRGRVGLICFDDSGAVTRSAVMCPDGEVIGANIPHGIFHTLVSLAPGSVFLEAKAGPYVPIAEAERAPWAPAEGDPDAAAFLSRLEQVFGRQGRREPEHRE